MKAQDLINLPRNYKQLLMASLDATLGLVTSWFALVLIFGGGFSTIEQEWVALLLAPALAFPVFWRFNLYRTVVRYADVAAIKNILKGVTCYGALFYLALYALNLPGIPSNLGIFQPLLLGAALVTSRIAVRFWLLSLLTDPKMRKLRKRLLIAGSSEKAIRLSSGLHNSLEYLQIGFVDDDVQRVNRFLLGHKVFHLDDLADVIQNFDVSDLVLCFDWQEQHKKARVIKSCLGLAVHIQEAQFSIGNDLSAIREIEVEDLLGRAHIPPLPDLMNRKNKAKTVLVTGAGGSIGSELCRQILATRPARLVLLENSEFNLYSIHRELQGRVQAYYPEVELITELADIRDKERIYQIFDELRPHTVYHAAAYKHVPLVENNPFDGVQNNTFGTITCAQAALRYDVVDFVLISTDKAVRPTNVMGASKRLAEMYLQALAKKVSNQGTRFSMVRFGNVLDSSGSVVPLFRDQIARGGPVTVTHPEVSRYFMTIPEASQLVIQAGAMARGGEVFMLDMGEPVKILDLARRMIDLAGLSIRNTQNPDGDIEIQFINLRPGEKLFEELLISDTPEKTSHPKIKRATEGYLPFNRLSVALEKLSEIVKDKDQEKLREYLMKMVDEHLPEQVHAERNENENSGVSAKAVRV
ncbi:MAG: nucleoside-diphosphate sugar epimerase/dehydratase [Limnobacter sp.]|nr:nucleoside-diphosphate sugar epimerase/dehydratase [Limnobacter sp.]